ncbi:MAG: hypothetical protein ACE5R7_04325 [Nitrosarchaeum sp.]
MHKSLGDYNIRKSSSADINNIKWTQKNQTDSDKTKNKKKTVNKIAPTNIIYTDDVKLHVEKIFKIEEVSDNEKTKDRINKKIHTSSVSNSNIQYSYSRRAR